MKKYLIAFIAFPIAALASDVIPSQKCFRELRRIAVKKEKNVEPGNSVLNRYSLFYPQRGASWSVRAGETQAFVISVGLDKSYGDYAQYDFYGTFDENTCDVQSIDRKYDPSNN